MKLHTLLIGTALTSGLLAAAGTLPAFAGPINLGGYSGAIDLNFNNYESFMTSTGTVGTSTNPIAPAQGDTNFGIFTVYSLTRATTLKLPIFSAGQGGDVLVGVFNDINVKSVTGTAATEKTYNTGGVFQLYEVPAASFLADGGDQGLAGYTNAGCAVGSLCYNGITNVVGSTTPILTLDLTGGVDPSDSTITLEATVNANDNPPTGSANFEGVVTGTSQEFANDTITGQDSFCSNVIGSNCSSTPDGSSFELSSQDPIVGTPAKVPEPASLALFGAGLLGFGWLSWRRRKSA